MSAIIEKEEIKICFRFLEEDEYHKLESIYTEYNDKVPPASLGRIGIGELDDGSIIGFIANTLTPTITLWIDEPYRHSGLWVKLVEMMMPLAEKTDELGIRTYVICTRPETVAICERLGMRKIEHPVYVRDVF